MRNLFAVCLGIVLLSMLCSMPVAADVPTDIVDQYWVWYPVQFQPPTGGPPGYWVNYINKLEVGAPVWGPNYDTLDILNVAVPNRIKNVWLEVKYVLPQTQMADVRLIDPAGVSYQPVKSWISTNGQFLTWQWTLPFQPSFETLSFGSTDFHTLRGMELVEVGTQCVPEPTGILALMTGVASFLGFLVRRKA